MQTLKKLEKQQLNDILAKVAKVNIGLIGDLCLDVYWKADMRRSELSRETPHFPLPVVEEYMSPGGGGNVCANIAALKPARVEAIGVIGNDWRGNALLAELKKRGIGEENLVISDEVVTNTYCKPIRMGISDVMYEDPRLDFCNYSPLSGVDETALLVNLDRVVRDLDILCVSDQFMYGCVTPVIRKQIMKYAAEGLKVIVDSRYKIGEYEGVIMKPNEIEGWQVVHGTDKARVDTFEAYMETVKKLVQINKAPVCMTLGDKGCLYSDEWQTMHIEAYPVEPPIDIVGAGDTFLAAFGLALGAGVEPGLAAAFGNLAAGVTIKKIGTTGTASPEEMMEKLTEQ